MANDTTTLYGLPEPIHEAVKVLKKYHYMSLGEVQIKREADFAKYPLLLVSLLRVFPVKHFMTDLSGCNCCLSAVTFNRKSDQVDLFIYFTFQTQHDLPKSCH